MPWVTGGSHTHTHTTPVPLPAARSPAAQPPPVALERCLPLPPALHLEKGSFRIILLLAIVIALSRNSLRRKTEAVKDISLMRFVV